MSLLDGFPHLCTAKQRARTTDELGGGVDTYTTLFADRACWIQQAGDSQVADFSKRGISVSNKVYFTADPEIDETCILVAYGLTYDVVSAPELDASAGLGVVWRVMVNQKSTNA